MKSLSVHWNLLQLSDSLEIPGCHAAFRFPWHPLDQISQTTCKESADYQTFHEKLPSEKLRDHVSRPTGTFMFWTLCVFCFLEFSVLLFCCLVLFFSVSLVCSCVYVHLLSPVLHHPVCCLLSVYFSSCFILKYFLLLSGHLYLLCLIISCISPLSRFPHLCLVCNHSPCIYCPVFSSVLVESTAFILFLFYVYSMFIPCSWLVFLCLCLLRFWYVPVTSALNISASDLACLPSLHLGPPAPLTHLRDTMWDSWTLRFCFGACLKS